MLKYITILAFSILSQLSIGQNYILHCGSIIDTDKEVVLKEKSIIVKGDTVHSIVDGYQKPKKGQEVIDLKSMTVLPGLIDMHVHIEGEVTKESYYETLNMNDSDISLRATNYAEITLKSGFTTVRDLGGSGINISIRNAINKGFIEGPRIYTAGKAIGSTGGHADPTNGFSHRWMGDPGPAEGVANGVSDCQKAVRQRYKNGADCIKITATGGVLSVAKNSSNPQFTLEEITAICQTANDYGFHVAAHAHGDEGMRRAVLGGVTTIEHGTLMSEETMKLMKEKGTFLIPTLTAGKEVADNAEIEGFYPDVVVPKAREIGPKLQGTLAKAYKMGVPIGFGTDAGVFAHGENGKEFQLMVDAGMPMMKVLKAATVVNAGILKNDKIGNLNSGSFADIVAFPENPLKNVGIMTSPSFVMKGGKRYL